MGKRYLFVLVFFLLLVTEGWAATLVLAPSGLSEKENAPYQEIIRGIRRAKSDVQTVRLLPFQISSRLASYPGEVTEVIVLGDTLAEAYSRLSIDIPWVAGGFVGDLDTDVVLDAVSLNTDPEIVFQEIKKINSSINTVYTVSSQTSNTELIKRARRVASENDLELVVVEAFSMRETARGWFSIFRNINSRRAAVWIHDNTFLEESGSFKYVNETSWSQGVLHISSVPSHAVRGVAIGFLPELQNYGVSLANRLTRQIRSRAGREISFLPRSAIRRVINERTIKHQGFRLPRDLDRLDTEDVLIQ